MTAFLFLESNHSPAINTSGLLQQTGAAQGVGEPPLLFLPGQPGNAGSACPFAERLPHALCLLLSGFILHRCDSSGTRPASVSDIKGWRDAPSCRSRRLEVTQLNDGPCTSLAEHKMLRALAC